ncbi:uncharacterized protein LOC101755175 isoform X1 [Setaria italica]|uniref:glutathione transferase n=1 Tax=Setaria viridis TaxID=4556 RepID=A0A4U6UID2_SETVI|nr:uncharacterized protein LOC101755175 isoform X1 [Setaria italica]TKW14474.1 hypothetical protein SEVIR_5G170600v2 [Setaria viridis]
MAPVKVFGPAISTNVSRVLLCLEEVGVGYEVVDVNFAAGEHKGPEHLERNIPAFQDGGLMLFAWRTSATSPTRSTSWPRHMHRCSIRRPAAQILIVRGTRHSIPFVFSSVYFAVRTTSIMCECDVWTVDFVMLQPYVIANQLHKKINGISNVSGITSQTIIYVETCILELLSALTCCQAPSDGERSRNAPIPLLDRFVPKVNALAVAVPFSLSATVNGIDS